MSAVPSGLSRKDGCGNVAPALKRKGQNDLPAESEVAMTHSAVRYRPVLFKAEMMRAILDGKKTQTRRIAKEPKWAESGTLDIYYSDRFSAIAKSSGCLADILPPLGQPGDRLWVRETFAIESTLGVQELAEVPDDGRPIRHIVDDSLECDWYEFPRYRATEPKTMLICVNDGDEEDAMRWTPSIFMPRWASRITLEITEVRVQRVQEISEQDAEAEGAERSDEGAAWYEVRDVVPNGEAREGPSFAYRAGFAELWQSIHGESHHSDWVFAYTFKRVEA